VELRNLDHFLAVAEAESFTRAAARLHVVQSTLSVSVRALEHELGVTLFERTTRRVELTDAGRALVGPVRAALAAVGTVTDTAAGMLAGTHGVLRVGIMHSLPGFDLAALISAFHRERPHVQIVPSTHPDGSEGLARDVAERRLDLALAALGGEARSAHYPGLTIADLASEPIRLACPPGHRFAGRKVVRLAELVDETFIDVPPQWGSRLSTDRLFAEQGLRRNVAIEVGDVATVTELIRAGLGLAFVAPSSAPAEVRGQLVDVRPHPVFTVSMVTARDRPLSAVAARFAEMIRETLAAGTN
jgi:DNA-binding transcriptional LysR family regulator